MVNCTADKLPVLVAYFADKKEYLMYQPRCKLWSCEPCANINRLLWQARIGYGYEYYNLIGIDGWRMLTITSHPRARTFEQCLHIWKNAWTRLSSRMRNQCPKFRYVLLPELHKDDRLHWHMVASGDITQRWLKDNSAACGLGYMAESTKIRETMEAIGYVSKYVSKSIYQTKWPSNMRRISTSQKWPGLPTDENFKEYDVDWEYLHSYPPEGLGYLAVEWERKTKVPTRVLGSSQ